MECSGVEKNDPDQQIGFLFVIYSDRIKQEFTCERCVQEEGNILRAT